VKEFLRHL